MGSLESWVLVPPLLCDLEQDPALSGAQFLRHNTSQSKVVSMAENKPLVIASG